MGRNDDIKGLDEAQYQYDNMMPYDRLGRCEHGKTLHQYCPVCDEPDYWKAEYEGEYD